MNALAQQLKNLHNQPIALGDEVGRGGEGAVFAIKNSPNFVVKIYHQVPTRDKAEKILSMVRLGNERLINLTSWPLAAYYSNSGDLSGFIMPRLVNHHSLYELYNPKLRLVKFPKADWRFLVHAATNVARAFAAIHDSGHVIGDINHGNLVVTQDATVRFIDTDSFQIIDNKKCWHCEVGVSTHQPPEMQGHSSFSNVSRTPNHDNFGLAILIFQILFLGRHPFSGRFQGKGEMPIEKAIAEYRFAYSSNHHILQMLPPPASLPMTALTSHLRILFERAFSKEGSGFAVGLRPTPDEWVIALTTLATALIPCSSNNGHYYNKELNTCPWCNIESQSASSLFPFVIPDKTIDTDITSIWLKIISIKDPGPEPALPPLIGYPLAPSLKAANINKELRQIKTYSCLIWLAFFILTCFLGNCGSGFLIFSGLLGIVLFPFRAMRYYGQRKKQLTQGITTELDEIVQNWEALINEWKIASSNISYSILRLRIDHSKEEFDATSRGREQLIQQYRKKSHHDRLQLHLTNFPIAKANLQGIGTERIAALKHHRIETAADVDAIRLQGVRGFGAVFCSRLINWRQQLAASFVFDPNKGLSNQELAAIDISISEKRKQIAKELSSAASQLSCITQQVHERRQKLNFEALDIIAKYSQLVADARAVGVGVDY